ncbi:MAG: potassium channel protein [Synechococcales cyanobacterium C42_A2020_086]|jgi:voltage-gated potassium channel|nr:potassium channel protein [Synechococcales cyanobacterium M58_A2018_015]MBF2073039.1 potassium channel protein [Synechococcales cyanobacterium C42_A2020_086]
MQSPLRRILTGAIFLVVTLVGAIIGYSLLGCPLLDAVYMVIITIFGVGYGEFCPVSPAQRILTIIVIVAGSSAAVYTVGGFVQMLTEGEIKQAFDRHRKARDLAKLQQHTVICGFGRIGQVLARKLHESQQPFVIVDNNESRITYAEELGYRVCEGNAADEDILLTAGIQRAKTLATVLPDDAVNVFITLTARGLNPNLMIVARGEMPSTEKKLRLAGADHVVSPANISGMRIATLITHPNTIEFLDQGEERTRLNELLAQIDVQVDELTIPAGSPLVGRPLRDLEVRGNGAFVVVALRKANGAIVTHPSHETLLHAQDVVIVLGHRGDIPQLGHLFEMKPQIRYRGAQS